MRKGRQLGFKKREKPERRESERSDEKPKSHGIGRRTVCPSGRADGCTAPSNITSRYNNADARCDTSLKKGGGGVSLRHSTVQSKLEIDGFSLTCQSSELGAL